MEMHVLYTHIMYLILSIQLLMLLTLHDFNDDSETSPVLSLHQWLVSTSFSVSLMQFSHRVLNETIFFNCCFLFSQSRT